MAGFFKNINLKLDITSDFEHFIIVERGCFVIFV